MNTDRRDHFENLTMNKRHATKIIRALLLCISLNQVFGLGARAAPVEASDRIDESAIALLSAVAAASGDRTIHTATISYTVQATGPMPSEDFVQQVIKDGTETYTRAIAGAQDDDSRKRLQQHLDEIEKNVRRQLVANSKAPLDVFYAMNGPALGGDRYFEITRHPEGRPAETLEVVYRSLGVGGYISMRNERRRSTVLIENQPMYYGTEEPHRLGRLMGSLAEVLGGAFPSSTDLARIVSSITLHDGGSFQGHDSVSVQVVFRGAEESEKSSGATTFTTVPGMGHVVPLIRDLASDGTLLTEIDCSEYVSLSQATGDALWFPLRVTVNQFDLEGTPLRAAEYQFDANAISLNGPLSDERFKISLSPRLTVADTRVSPAESYSVGEETTLGLDDVEDLAAITALKPVVIQPRVDSPATIQGSRWPGLLVINLVVVSALLAVLWWRRRRATTALILVAFVLPGCNRTVGFGDSGASAVRDSGLTISPEIVDFGRVSSSSEVHQRAVQIRNQWAGPRHITIETSCGCLTASPLTFVLNKGESATVTVSLTPDGTPGIRRSQISVTSLADRDVGFECPNEPKITNAIVAQATITNEWHAMPRRMVITSAPSTGAQTVKVTAPQSDWGRTRIGTIGHDVIWHEMSRNASHEESGECRTFRVEIGSDERRDRGLCFTLAGHDSPILVVPIVAASEQPRSP